MTRCLAAVVGAAGAGAAAATAQAGKTLDIYVADTEGGKAALFVVADRADAADRQRQSRASATSIASWR